MLFSKFIFPATLLHTLFSTIDTMVFSAIVRCHKWCQVRQLLKTKTFHLRYAEIHQWAKIDTAKLKDILEWVVLNPDKAREIGLKGRKAMFEKFERNMVAQTVADRISEIKKEILAKGIASYKSVKLLKNKERALENTYGDHGVPDALNDVRNRLNTLERLADSSDKSLDKIVEELRKQYQETLQAREDHKDMEEHNEVLDNEGAKVKVFNSPDVDTTDNDDHDDRDDAENNEGEKVV